MRRRRRAMELLWVLVVAGWIVAADCKRGPDTVFEFVNSAAPPPSGGTIADMIDRVLDKEFPQEASEGKVGSSFNNSVTEKQAVLETVARVKPKRNESQEQNRTGKVFQIQDVFEDNGAEDLPTLIDNKDNVFVISNPRSGYMVLQQDVRFISDLVVVIVSAATGGVLFACLGQPVITGYLLAGSIIGPGGLSMVSELVQVETVAQFGIVFLLFALGLEFSFSKLRVVTGVAILGGLCQILLFMCLCGVAAMMFGAAVSEGVFVGAFLSMSSTTVVLKFLSERNGLNTLYGQITVGTLILQDCAVGLLFALLPIIGGEGGVIQGTISLLSRLFVLSGFVMVATLITRMILPRCVKLMMRLSTLTSELYQLATVAFCLLVAWCSEKAGLSFELGAFTAGVMISTTDLAEPTLHQVESVRNLFSALFLASIGMLINIQFLWVHLDILVASLVVIIVAKTVVVAAVVKLFGYQLRTAVMVGVALAQIGEFAFVLLSRASNLHLVQKKLYLLLLGTTALSLVTTPLLFKMIPAIVRVATVMRWFPGSSQVEMGSKVPPESDLENPAEHVV